MKHQLTHSQNELCVASGPGVDMVDSTRIIGQKQFQLVCIILYCIVLPSCIDLQAQELYENATVQLKVRIIRIVAFS